MKTLALANQKGGVGKTAAAVHLAFYMAERGQRVLVVDLDAQQNASFSLQEHDSGVEASALFGTKAVTVTPTETGITLIRADADLAGVENMDMAVAANNFNDNLERLASQFDVCVLDTAPAAGVRMAAALFAAGFLISPIELEAYSLQGISHMVNVVTNIRESNPDLEFLGMVASKVDRRNPRQVRHDTELREQWSELLIPVSIGLRNTVADALESGIPVWKIRKTSARRAAKEMKAFGRFVCQRMGLPA